MKLEPTDPRWTMFVLEPEALSAEERQACETQVAADAECQALVQELKQAAGRLSAELRTELKPAEEVKLPAAAIGLPERVPTVASRRWRFALGTSLAGFVITGAVLLLLPAVHTAREASLSMRVQYQANLDSLQDLHADIEVLQSQLAEMKAARRQTIAELRTSPSFTDAATYADCGRNTLVGVADGDKADRDEIFRSVVKLTDSLEQASGKPGDPFAGGGIRFGFSLNNDGQPQPFNSESYPILPENPFTKPIGIEALSTFSIDVDTAAYSNIRRFLQHSTRPPAGSVRLEEMINYFPYDYAPPKDDRPFAVHVETAACPWEAKHRLVRVALKGKVIEENKRPASNLVFLLDVSGSMNQPNKLPLVKRSLQMLVEQLTENDAVAIAVYAGSSGLVLDSTPGNNKREILAAIDSLQPSGSTNGAAGIKVAYDAAVKGFLPKGTNRVILCTDGDFNVGVSSDDELVDLITEKAKTGVFLSVLGFGMGNYKDAKMMGLADKGNGNYAYIDNLREAQKVLVEQMSGTLVTIAKDVKIQVEFNPQKVAAYRLVGYEKRKLAAQDFKDDKKDAGEIGAGHTVTAFYEVVPANVAIPGENVDPLEFQPNPAKGELPAELANLAMRVKLRYKQPDGDTSVEFAVPVADETKAFTAASKDFQFAAAVAGFGRVLRAGEKEAKLTLAAIAEIATSAIGKDAGGYRAEFVDLVGKAQQLPEFGKRE